MSWTSCFTVQGSPPSAGISTKCYRRPFQGIGQHCPEQLHAAEGMVTTASVQIRGQKESLSSGDFFTKTAMGCPSTHSKTVGHAVWGSVSSVGEPWGVSVQLLMPVTMYFPPEPHSSLPLRGHSCLACGCGDCSPTHLPLLGFQLPWTCGGPVGGPPALSRPPPCARPPFRL